MKISFIKAIVFPFGAIGDNVKSFLKISFAYALTLTALGFLLGSTYACLIPNATNNPFYCSQYGWGFFAYQLIKLVLIASFMKNWNLIAFDKQKINLKPSKVELNIFLTLLGFLIICMLPLVSFSFLYQRVPNPDYRIEILYFTFVSIGIWLPFLLIRLLPLIGYAASANAFPKIKDIWQKTKQSSFRISAFLMILGILFIFLISSFSQSFASIKDNFTFANVFFTDFIYNISMLLMLAIFTNHCIILSDFIKGEK